MLRVFEAFSGIGTQRMALRNLGIEHEVVGISEIDGAALKSYEAIHGDCPNFGDISKVNPNDLPDFDLFTYSFPCQDLSIAGQLKGLERNRTRSGLLYECEKIIETKRPKYLLLENVKNLVGSKFRPSFEEWLAYLESLGYTNYWKVLNAKDFNVPQNRERVFVVSILGEHTPYKFPESIPLTHCVHDLLEEEVEDRFYVNLPLRLSPDYLEQAKPAVLRQERTAYGKAIRKQYEAGLIQEKRSNMREFKPRPDGLSNTLTTVQKDNYLVEPKLWFVGGIGTKDWAGDGKCYSRNFPQGNRVYDSLGIACTQTAQGGGLGSYTGLYCVEDLPDYRVRKLTPKECWRLMGFLDEDYEKASQVVSQSQLYKQAGNAIVVPVLEGLFCQLFLN